MRLLYIKVVFFFYCYLFIKNYNNKKRKFYLLSLSVDNSFRISLLPTKYSSILLSFILNRMSSFTLSLLKSSVIFNLSLI